MSYPCNLSNVMIDDDDKEVPMCVIFIISIVVIGRSIVITMFA